jgi:hypothetical protein
MIRTQPYKRFKHRISSAVLDVKKSKNHKAERSSLNQDKDRDLHKISLNKCSSFEDLFGCLGPFLSWYFSYHTSLYGKVTTRRVTEDMNYR